MPFSPEKSGLTSLIPSNNTSPFPFFDRLTRIFWSFVWCVSSRHVLSSRWFPQNLGQHQWVHHVTEAQTNQAILGKSVDFEHMTNSTTPLLNSPCAPCSVISQEFLIVSVIIPSPFRGCGFHSSSRGYGQSLPTSLTNFHFADMGLQTMETLYGPLYDQGSNGSIFRLSWRTVGSAMDTSKHAERLSSHTCSFTWLPSSQWCLKLKRENKATTAKTCAPRHTLSMHALMFPRFPSYFWTFVRMSRIIRIVRPEMNALWCSQWILMFLTCWHMSKKWWS